MLLNRGKGTFMHFIAVSAGVDFTSGWNALWGAFKGAMPPGAATLLSIIGVALLVYAIIKFWWDKRKGGGMGGGMGAGGGGLSSVAVALVIGTIFCAPEIIIPIFLKFCEIVANFGTALFAGF